MYMCVCMYISMWGCSSECRYKRRTALADGGVAGEYHLDVSLLGDALVEVQLNGGLDRALRVHGVLAGASDERNIQLLGHGLGCGGLAPRST